MTKSSPTKLKFEEIGRGADFIQMRVTVVEDTYKTTRLPTEEEWANAAVNHTSEYSALDTQVGGGHYKKWPIQPVEFCYANKIPFLEGNIMKYAIRHKDKNGIEDLRKAKHYLELLAELEYGEEL